MRLTTKGRFAVTAMLDLALQQAQIQSPVSLASISQRQDISLSYLEQLFGKLRRSELVTSSRGANGGYMLARPIEQITVADIITAVDEMLDATQCGGMGNCKSDEHDNRAQCMTHDLWVSLNVKMLDYLASVSLQTLVSQQHHNQLKPIHFAKAHVQHAELKDELMTTSII